MTAAAEGRIGPNALLQLIPVLDRALGAPDRLRLFARAGVEAVPSDRMIAEGPVAQVHRAVRARLPEGAVDSIGAGIFLTGGTSLGVIFMPNYRLWVVGASITVCLATWLLIEKTRLGSYLRAATEPRSRAQRDAFQRAHPCPATGKSTGACPGYVIDHKVALKRGGADVPQNMQWQTKQAAKAKDKVE